jgi:hypothetical protein
MVAAYFIVCKKMKSKKRKLEFFIAEKQEI